MRPSANPSSKFAFFGMTTAAICMVAVVVSLVWHVSPSAADREEPTAQSPKERLAGLPTDDAAREGAGRAMAEESAAKRVVVDSGRKDPTVSEEETAENEREANVSSFEDLTDRWSEPAKSGVGLKDVEAFSETFRKVPADRRDECIHRALNLIPDENIMLLAGVLTDKTMDREIVAAVFHDILNRDESVKLPLLRQIQKDRTHPCWEDANWIIDAAK